MAEKTISRDGKQIDSMIDKLSIITSGMTNRLPAAATEILNKNLADLESKLDSFSSIIGSHNSRETTTKSILSSMVSGDIGNNIRNLPDIQSDLDAVRNYYEKFYSTLKDYETIPSLVPQVTRVLKFLVNEVVSPDIHNKKSFAVNADPDVIDEIDRIIREHKLYQELPKIVEDRFRLGKVFYLVQGYSTLFKMVGEMNPGDIMLNESAMNTIGNRMRSLTETHAVTGRVDVKVPILESNTNKEAVRDFSINLEDLDITIEYGSIASDYKRYLKTVRSELNESTRFSSKGMLGKEPKISFSEFMLAESYIRNGYDRKKLNKILNESSMNDKRERIVSIAKKLADKDSIRRATIMNLDPARVFVLRATNRVIGYFYYEDDEVNRQTLNFSDLLVKNLKNAKIGKDAFKVAEENVSKKASSFIIDNVKQTLDIEDVSDMDLFVDYIMNSNITAGKKKFKFYHKDDIIDISRTNGSLLINSVYQAKMLAILMHNNIVTKLVKGRDREIFTVNMGASASVSPYLNAAMESLASANDGVYRSLNGPISKILNPYQNSSIIIPSESGSDEFIKADIIQGQDVDMDMDIIKFLLNNIITSYGVDPGIIDLLNNNVDFAKSLTMINKEMLIMNINEQLDFMNGFEELVLNVLYEEGSDKLREEIDADKVDIKLFEPKSLILDIVQNEIGNAKSFAETLAETHPILSSIQEDDEVTKKIAVWKLMQEFVSANFGDYDSVIKEAINIDFSATKAELDAYNELRKIKVQNENPEEEGTEGEEDSSEW